MRGDGLFPGRIRSGMDRFARARLVAEQLVVSELTRAAAMMPALLRAGWRRAAATRIRAGPAVMATRGACQASSTRG